eukprot:12165500-Alexandrium_andersonii.AAC.1
MALGAPASAALTARVAAQQVALDVLEGVERHELRPRLRLAPGDNVSSPVAIRPVHRAAPPMR